MSEPLHPSTDDLEWYVTLGLQQAVRGWSDARIDRIESHVEACAACADALAREAQLELTIEAAAHAKPAHGSLGAWVGGVVGAAALAIALTLAAFPGRPDASSTAVPAIDAGVELAVDGDIHE